MSTNPIEDVILTILDSGDRPLTLGILTYIVYLLYQANKALQHTDKKQTQAIRYLKSYLQCLTAKVNHLEKFNSKTHPDTWEGTPCDLPQFPTSIDNETKEDI